MVAVIVAGNDWSSTIRFLAMCTVTPRSVAACSNSSTWRVDRAKRETSAYHFSLPGDVRGGELRELRDPNAGLEEEWLLPVGSP